MYYAINSDYNMTIFCSEHSSLPSKNLSNVMTWVPRVTRGPLFRSMVKRESEGTGVSLT